MRTPTRNAFRISQGFGLNPQMYAQFGLKGHNGIDYATPVGSEIIAPESGTIEQGNDGTTGYGLHLKLFTENGEHVMAHLSRVVRTGKVSEGETIGFSGNTGFSTGPHLHWGYRRRNGFKGTVLDYGNGFLGYFDQTPLITKEKEMKHVQSMRFSDSATVYGLYAYERMEEVVGDIQLYSPPGLYKRSDGPEVSLMYGIPSFDSVRYLGLTPEHDMYVDHRDESIAEYKRTIDEQSRACAQRISELNSEIDRLKSEAPAPGSAPEKEGPVSLEDLIAEVFSRITKSISNKK